MGGWGWAENVFHSYVHFLKHKGLSKQLDHQLLYFYIQLVSIQVHNNLLTKLKGVFEVIWKTQIKSINQSKQQDECHDDTIEVGQDFNAFNNNANILWLLNPVSSDRVNTHDRGCNAPRDVIFSGRGLKNNK